MIAASVGGNVGSVEFKVLPDGTPCLSFGVASNEKVKGEEVTTWIRCSMYGKRAESLSTVVAKGSSVMVSGGLTLREYEGANGKGVSLEMRVDQLAFIGGKRDGADTAPRGDAPPRAQASPGGRGGYGGSGGGAPSTGGVAYPGVRSAGDFEVRFGNDKGKPISLVENLTGLRAFIVKGINDPSRAQYAERAKGQVNAIDEMIASRKGGGGGGGAAAPVDDGYGGGGDDGDLPF